MIVEHIWGGGDLSLLGHGIQMAGVPVVYACWGTALGECSKGLFSSIPGGGAHYLLRQTL